MPNLLCVSADNFFLFCLPMSPLNIVLEFRFCKGIGIENSWVQTMGEGIDCGSVLGEQGRLNNGGKGRTTITEQQ